MPEPKGMNSIHSASIPRYVHI